jgi:Trp operon repressor
MGNRRHQRDNFVLLIMLFIGFVKNVLQYLLNLLLTADQIKLPLIERVELYSTLVNITCYTDVFSRAPYEMVI